MIFVDTGAWIALSDRKDQHHGDTVAIYTRLKRQKERFLTTDYLVDETVTRLRYDLSHSTAVRFLDFIERAEETGVLTVVEIDRTLFQEAKRLFRRYNVDTILQSYHLQIARVLRFVRCIKSLLLLPSINILR